MIKKLRNNPKPERLYAEHMAVLKAMQTAFPDAPEVQVVSEGVGCINIWVDDTLAFASGRCRSQRSREVALALRPRPTSGARHH